MRSSAFNYLEASWNSNNSSILQKRVSILLGLRLLQTRSVTDVFVDRGMEPISAGQLQQTPPGQEELDSAALNDFVLHEVPIDKSWDESKDESREEDQDRLFNQITFLKANSLSDSVLRSGVHLDRYLVGSTGEDDEFHLIFRPDQRQLWWNLASYGTKEEAIVSANDLRRFMIRLNADSEGFYVVEHILLRPLNPDPPDDIEIPEDFYSFTISVIFPGWTARFHDDMFRRFAEETVQVNCPAHIYPEFHWLDFQRMREFEGIYQQWLATKSSESANTQEIDSASTKLISFILEIRAKSSDGVGEMAAGL